MRTKYVLTTIITAKIVMKKKKNNKNSHVSLRMLLFNIHIWSHYRHDWFQQPYIIYKSKAFLIGCMVTWLQSIIIFTLLWYSRMVWDEPEYTTEQKRDRDRCIDISKHLNLWCQSFFFHVYRIACSIADKKVTDDPISITKKIITLN